jgi:hypothetical protein
VSTEAVSPQVGILARGLPLHVLEIEITFIGTSNPYVEELPTQLLRVLHSPIGQNAVKINAESLASTPSYRGEGLYARRLFYQPRRLGTYSSCPYRRGRAQFSTYCKSYVLLVSSVIRSKGYLNVVIPFLSLVHL